MTKSYEEIGQLCLQWWKSLQTGGGISDEEGDEVSDSTGAPDSNDKAGSDQKNNNNPGDKATLARLRRAASPEEALREAQTIRLAKKLGVTPNEPHLTEKEPRNLMRVGVIAAVLAEVKEHKGKQNTPRMLGPKTEVDENPPMSSLRFRALLAARDEADLLREMRRAVKLLGNKINVKNLASDIYFWGDNTRVNWSYHYWQEEPPVSAAPDQDPTITTPNNQADTH